jgi:hypothetical protein
MIRRITIKTPISHDCDYTMVYNLVDLPSNRPGYFTDSTALQNILYMFDPGPEYVVVFTEADPLSTTDSPGMVMRHDH